MCVCGSGPGFNFITSHMTFLCLLKGLRVNNFRWLVCWKSYISLFKTVREQRRGLLEFQLDPWGGVIRPQPCTWNQEGERLALIERFVLLVVGCFAPSTRSCCRDVDFVQLLRGQAWFGWLPTRLSACISIQTDKVSLLLPLVTLYL